MDRFDKKSWSEEKNFLECTKQYLEKIGVPQGGVEDDDQYEM